MGNTKKPTVEIITNPISPVEELKSLNFKQRQLYSKFIEYKMDCLEDFIYAFSGEKGLKLNKHALVIKTVKMLTFTTQEEFNVFFNKLSSNVQKAITIGTYYRYVEIEELDTTEGSIITVNKNGFGFETVFTIADNSDLKFLVLLNQFTLYLPEVFRTLFKPFVQKPENFELSPIEVPSSYYSNRETIIESIPIAIETLKQFKSDEIYSKGFLKTQARQFQEKCAIQSFPEGEKLGLFSADLLCKFLIAFKTTVTEDITQDIKDCVSVFFSAEKCSKSNPNLKNSLFEYKTLLRHLSGGLNKNGYSDSISKFPITRNTILNVLSRIQENKWYTIDDLFRSAWYREEELRITDLYYELHNLSLKGSTLTIANKHIEVDPYYEYFTVSLDIEPYILLKPMFQAYMYLFASLGLLEIYEEEAAKPLIRNGKDLPISMYDSLYALRITPLGSWCFGFTEKKPTTEVNSSLVLADSNLPILTIQGKSLEKRIYLESIGRAIGPERYRVTESSFISGCEKTKQIEERIHKFHTLVNENPPALWVKLFETIRTKSSIFTVTEQALLFKVPENPELQKIFYTDPVLKKLAIKTEGLYITVKRSDFTKLAKALHDNGFFCPSLADLTILTK